MVLRHDDFPLIYHPHTAASVINSIACRGLSLIIHQLEPLSLVITKEKGSAVNKMASASKNVSLFSCNHRANSGLLTR